MSTVLNQLGSHSLEEKRALLAKLLQKKTAQVRTFPLSFAQERLWFLDQLEPGGSYNMRAVIQLSGQLNLAAMTVTLNEIVRRHEILRTTFRVADDQPVQVVAPSLTLPLPLLDLSELDEAPRKIEAERRMAQEIARPFDLTQGPLLRAGLLKLGPTDHVLLLTMHHIISDGWSRGVLVRELGALYEAFSSGQPSPLPKLPIQYGDYAAWQRRWLSGEVLDRMVSYWKAQLKDLTPLELPTDRPRPAVQRYLGAKHRQVLPPSLSEGLWALSRREGVTPFMTLLAAFNVLLHRYTGQEDIPIGSPTASRKRAETEGLIGFFVNTLVLRTDLSGDPTFRELVGRVRQVCQGAYAHEDLPFAKLVEELQPQRALNRTPLYQVMFAFHNAPKPPLEVPNLVLTPLRDIDSGTAKTDLLLTLGGRNDQDRFVSMEYNTDLFEEATIARMLRHFQNLLEGIVADPDRRLSQLPLLSEEERRQLLADWSGGGAFHPKGECLPERFEAQAARTPDAVAVSCEDRALTYAELNRRANRLAHHLRGLGVGPETLVAVFLERSEELIVTLLAVLKAGGAYLPLDPAYPPERLGFLLADSQARVLVTRSALAETLPPHPARLVCLDADAEAIARQGAGNAASGAGPENLAYVIYTSGSTGTPKGVQVTHYNVVRLFEATQAWFHFDDTDVWTWFHSCAFDFSVWELWGALLYGGRLVVVPYLTSRSPEDFYGLLRSEGVTVLNQTPSAFRQLIALETERGAADDLALRLVIFGGEALDLQSLWPWFDRHGDTEPRLVNMYGITETTVHVTYRPVTSVDLLARAGSVIGEPIPDLRVYLLDRNRQPVPVGVPGELYVGGAGVARGYLNRPELTVERFLPDPFSANGGRLYRSGDLARWLPDGDLEYLGRGDDQVKIRGFRIELGEIEAVLGQHPAVRQAVVLARSDEAGGKRLVAYVIPTQPPVPATGELRGFLKEKLPDYMVPSAFVYLEALPLTANGKVDRRALPAPEVVQSASVAEDVVPRTPLEELIAGLWAEVLGVERVGVHDDFFELGGHSLLATQLISRVRGKLSVDVPLRLFFESPTVAALARHLEAARQAGPGVAAPPLVPVPREAELPLSFAQQRLWFLDQLQPGSAAYNVPANVHLSGCLDVEALEQALNDVVRRHEILRTTFAASDGRAVQVIALTADLDLEMMDLSGLSEEKREAEVRALAAAEMGRPFDLAGGPLLRAKLLGLAPHEHVVLCTLHHIVADAWSIGILVREIALLYGAYSQGRPSPLPELPIQYADFAVWQRQWLQGEVLEQQLAYWKKQLAGVPPLELPTDRPRPAVQTFEGGVRSRPLPLALRQGLEGLSRSEGATLFMTLLAAFQALLQRYSSQEDVCVGSPIAGRNRAETEPLIGFFVNTLALRTDLAGDPTFRELLGRVREMTLDAYAHQDLPFEKLVDEIQPQRDLSRTPLFQVVFVLQNAPMPELKLPALTLRPLGQQEGETAKFDLTLTMRETSQGLNANCHFNRNLFDPATIDRLLGHFQTLLDGVVADPDRRLSQLPWLAEAERHQVLVEWTGGQAAFCPGPTLAELFETQAARTPQAPAVSCEGRSLSYAELNARANRLAHRLRALGTGPDKLVGVYLERSENLVLTLLAVLKAGGAYLPLDPAYPPARLAFMLADSRAEVLVTQQALADTLPPHAAQLVCLDTDRDTIAAAPASKPAGVTQPEHLAYVIYTSGSTGTPKGVQVSHYNVVRLFQATQAWYHFGAQDVWTLFHSYAFDFSVWELWGALLYGGRLVVVPYHVSRSPEDFYALLRAEGVTVLNQTPSAFKQLVALEDTQGVAPDLALRLVIFGGEALELQSLRPWFDKHGDQKPQLVNMYGITETTVHVTYRPIAAADLDTAPGSVIGGPIPDLRLYVLDRYRQPVPVGVRGELYVGGAGVARGYLNRPELNAERFISDPFAENGGRLYKSGDLARWRPGGDLEYLGRGDDQVKIRGFRIELGEIEAVLGQHPQVREAVVVPRTDGADGKRLVAYVVARPESVPSVGELRSLLKGKLPEYMVPAAFVFLEALPLTANGKVDRRALPAPDKARPELGREYVAPRTPAEEVLASIWAELLGRAQVGVHDNFFELGGDSILSIQVVARANRAGLRLSPKHLFQHQTIAALAEVAGSVRAVAAEQGPVSGPVPLTPIQRWFFEQDLAEPHHFNQALLLELRQAIVPAVLEEALGHLLAHHDALRLRFERTAEGWQQANAAPDAAVPFTIEDLSGLPEAEQGAAIEAHAAALQASLDLSAGPLLRVAYFDLGAGRPARLLWVIHHLAVDGVSWRVLLEDLVTVCQQLGRSQPVQLPPKTTSFQRWATALAAYARSDKLRGEASYWLAEPRARVSRLPVDYPGGVNTAGTADTVAVTLSAEETRALLQEVPEVYHTQINDVLLTALAQALAGWTGSEAVLVDLEGHGREESLAAVDLTRTVGWFTVLYPVLLSAGGPPGEALKAVKEQLRAVPRGGIGYGLLRYLSGDEATAKALRALPAAEVCFNYLGQLDRVLPDGAPLGRAPEARGPSHAAPGRRCYLLDINGSILGGQLRVSWTFGTQVYRRETVEGLARRFLEALRRLLAHCLSPEAGGYTPSDFPAAGLSQEKLDRLLSRIKRPDRSARS